MCKKVASRSRFICVDDASITFQLACQSETPARQLIISDDLIKVIVKSCIPIPPSLINVEKGSQSQSLFVDDTYIIP